MALGDYFVFGIFGLFIIFALIVGALATVVGIYYLFKRKKKLHQMPASNTNFKASQGKEFNKKSKEER